MLSRLHNCPVLTEDRADEQVLLCIIFQALAASVHQLITFFAFLQHAAVNGSGFPGEGTISIFKVTEQLWVDAEE